MKNFVQEGRFATISFPYAVTAGGGVKKGNLFGIAVNTQALSDNADIAVTGVFDLAKDTSTFADGDIVYWDDTNKVATSTTTNNVSIGVAELLSPDATSAPGGSSGDATVRVRLNAAFPSAQGSINQAIAVTATVPLSAANLIAMNGAPVQILAAPGAGLAIVVDDILFEITTTSTQFTGGGVVSFVYHGGSVACHAGTIPAATVTAAAGTTNTQLGPAVAANGTVVPANTGIDITNATAAFAAGTGTAKVCIKYRVITL